MTNRPCFTLPLDFQDHGSEGVQTTVQDHGFARVGTMQVQAIMPAQKSGCSRECFECQVFFRRGEKQEEHPRERTREHSREHLALEGSEGIPGKGKGKNTLKTP